jgi:yecA family protein
LLAEDSVGAHVYPLPFDDTEHAELQRALGSRSVDALLGFMTALVSLPEMIPTGAWLGELLKDADLSDGPHIERVASHLARLNNLIASALSFSEIERFCPAASDEPACRAWAQGYLDVIDQIDLEGESDEVHEDVVALSSVALRVDDALLAPELEGMTPEAYRAASRKELAAIAAELHQTWHKRRAGRRR